MKAFLEQLLLILIYGGIIQGIFIVLLLNNKSVRKDRSNLFLSILLVTLSFSIAHILFAGAVINHLSARIYSLGDPTFFLIAPLLWFYVQELTGIRVVFSWKLLAHFLPFAVVIFFSLTLRSIESASFVAFLSAHHRFFNILFWIAVVVQFSWYQVLVHRRWIIYQGIMQQEVSNTENVSISWVRFFMGVFLAINLLFLFALFAVIHFRDNAWLARTTALLFSLSVFALGYKGILQKGIFDTLPRRHDDAQPNPGYSLKAKPEQALIDRLLDYMERTKPYLDPDLTLSKLADDFKVSRSQLSQLINEGIGDNFYNFINKYRVEEVKKLMVDPRFGNHNMLGLALEAGFKSKSTFNLIFKRFTGLTPTEYRKNLSE